MGDERHRTTAQETRFIALETKVAYQDKLLQDLNEVLLERGNALDRLEKRVSALESRLRAEDEAIGDPEQPPHY